ncbi:MAG: protein kinase, partial [Acidobacteriota bacterium]
MKSGTEVGPYVLGERLGGGGMGDVYRAYDARLERWVALKHIHPDALSQPGARRRFRREARAAAALQHPSIVQVHDLIESDAGDWIVMELIEGQTLGERLRRGPLDLAEGLRVAAAVAEGLVAAHARGILHRDLKAENIMVSASGVVKILDFGIAKRLVTSASEPDGDELTAELSGQLLGTLRAMSPEQSRGLPLDERSDLFSLGVLLYEIFQGESPFRAAGPLATLERVRSYQQIPLADLGSTPAAVSFLVERLLEKNPARRPASARDVAEALVEQWVRHRRAPGSGSDSDPTDLSAPTEGFASASASGPAPTSVPGIDAAGGGRRRLAYLAGLTTAALVIAVWILGRASAPIPALYVAVLEPGLGEKNEDVAQRLAPTVHTAQIDGLLTLDAVAPLTTEGLDPLPATVRQIGRALGAEEVVASQLDCRREICQLEMRRLRVADGSVLWIDTLDVAPAEIPLLRKAIVGRLRAAYKERARGGPSIADPAHPYGRLVELRRAHREGALSADAALDAVAELRREAPDFLELHHLEAQVAYRRYFYGHEADDLERAFAALERARQQEPGDVQTLQQLIKLALDSGRLELARETLHALQQMAPGDLRHERWRGL